jgi:hypothetical protein
MVTGAAIVIGFAFLVVGYNNGSEAIEDVAGLIQRVVVTIGWTWLSLLAIHLLRVDARSASVAPVP